VLQAAVNDSDAPQSAKDAYLDELIVRRELGYNMTSLFTRHPRTMIHAVVLQTLK